MILNLTGRTRFRPHVGEGEDVLLVLQVEEVYGRGPVGTWRDAKIEDLRGKEIEVRA